MSVFCRLHLTQQKSVGSSVGQIPIPCSDVNRIVETAESARIKLFKSIEVRLTSVKGETTFLGTTLSFWGTTLTFLENASETRLLFI